MYRCNLSTEIRKGNLLINSIIFKTLVYLSIYLSTIYFPQKLEIISILLSSIHRWCVAIFLQEPKKFLKDPYPEFIFFFFDNEGRII